MGIEEKEIVICGPTGIGIVRCGLKGIVDRDRRKRNSDLWTGWGRNSECGPKGIVRRGLEGTKLERHDVD
ncbi:unnamed protein product [Colias eurytheme]|nr:unnamed protein product [Colias eurytheme]